MNKTVGLLFAGQGAQKVGMGKDLVETNAEACAVFAQADAVLGRSLTQVCFEGPIDELTKTSNCQPGIFVHSLACLAALKKEKPDLTVKFMAGLSLGEFSAHSAAGTFSFEEGLKLVQQRGTFMQEACEVTQGGMISLIGADETQARKIAAEADVDVANFNCPGQIVLSGESSKIARAIEVAQANGVKRVIPLTVAGAYHSRLMRSAQENLSAVVKGMKFNQPTCPVISNIHGVPAGTVEEIKDSVIGQVTSSVRWDESMRYAIAQGCTEYIELGPGNVLSGFMKRIDKNVTIHTICDAATLADTLMKL
ncbi:MAG: ACP S-malonyltransferase [Verrucomicrobiota bacterium]|nr:ACP S-malonyltransferase [Verrucomicrobiota bacterium]